MGCCMTRENKNLLTPNIVTKNEHVFYDNKGSTITMNDELEEQNDMIHFNKSNQIKNTINHFNNYDEINLSESSLKLKREDMLQISLIISSFDLWCNPGTFFNNYFCDFNPEVLLSFEDKFEIFNPEKNQVVGVDEDLNKSGQFELGCVEVTKRKTSSNDRVKDSQNSDKKIKQFLFENSTFTLNEMSIDKVLNSDKNSFINFSLVQKNKRDEKNKFIIGDGCLPVHFLFTTFKDNNDSDKIEILIYNHIDDLLIGKLNIRINVNFIPADQNNHNNLQYIVKNLFEIKNDKLNQLKNFLKFQIMSLREYGKIHRLPFNNEFDIESCDENLNKIDIHNIIHKYIIEKDEALKELYHYFYEYVDTSQNTSMNTDIDFKTSPYSQPTQINQKEKKRYRLDFKTLNQVKYFFFIQILNESLTKTDLDQNFNLLKTSKFLNEKIIFSPYETSKNENKNYLLSEKVISLLLNIKKNSTNPFDPRFKIDYLLAYYGIYYKKSCDHILTILEKNGIRMNLVENNFRNFGPLSNESYLVFRSIMYKFLKLIKMSLEIKNENLNNKENMNKYNELIEISLQDVEAFKRNPFYFLCVKETYFAKNDKKPIEKDLLYLKDFNYVIGIMNILLSYIKLAKNLAKNHLKILPVEFYISQLLSEDSEFLNFISVTLKIFYKNLKYLNLLLEITNELFSDSFGIFIFNFFKKVDMNLLFNSFHVDSKYLDSRKFASWNHLFIILSKCTKLIKKSYSDSIDFLNLNFNLIFKQLNSLYIIQHKNHYFKIADEIDVEYDTISNLIIIKNTKIKFLTNKIACKIQSKFFEIFYDFMNREALIIDYIKYDEISFNKVFKRMIFLIMLKIEGNLIEIVKINAEQFFKTYLNILFILENLKNKFKINLEKEIKNSIISIFPNNYSDIIDTFNYDKFFKNFRNKIKGIVPNKFDFNIVLNSIDKLIQNENYV